MLYWRRIKTFSLKDRVKNEVLYRVKEDRSILHTIKSMKANLLGHILRGN
jgi:hypothetical protein